MDQLTALISALTLFFSPQSYSLENVISSTLTPTQTPKQYTICVDPGHGGNDPGALNADLTEAEVNLNISRRLQNILEENNYTVVLTRENNDTALTNSERAEICNTHNADLLVSIHLNSSIDKSLEYTQALYGDASKDQAFATVMHSTLLKQLALEAPSEDAVTDFYSNLMLKANMPATLLETVFLSSDNEYYLLSDGSRQQQIADAIYAGISTWRERER